MYLNYTMFILEFYNSINDILMTYNKFINKINNNISDHQYYNYEHYYKIKNYNKSLYYYLLFYVDYFNLFPNNKHNIRNFIKKNIEY